MSDVSVVCCEVRGLCVGLITRQRSSTECGVSGVIKALII